MTDLLHKISAYFAAAVAVLLVLQPFAIPLTTVAHSVEVLAKRRGWARLQSVAYWVAKAAGTFSMVDLRNVARASAAVLGAVASVLAQIIALLPPTKAQRIQAVKDAAKEIGPVLLLIAALGSLALLTGCAGTLEETRGQMRVDSLLGVRQAVPRNDAYCRSLSSKERVWATASVAGAFLSGASGLTTIPVDSKRGDQLLAVGVVVSATGAVVGLALEQSYAREWQKEGCAQ